MAAAVCDLGLSLEEIPEFMPSIEVSLELDITVAEVSSLHHYGCSHGADSDQPDLDLPRCIPHGFSTYLSLALTLLRFGTASLVEASCMQPAPGIILDFLSGSAS